MSKNYYIAPEYAGMPNETLEFNYSKYSPMYKETGVLCASIGVDFFEPYEYTGWKDEQLSWAKTCYIHGNLNPSPTFLIKGPEAAKFLSKYCVNSFNTFPIGSGKHCFCCAEDGSILSDGIIIRVEENTYITYWVFSLAMYAAEDGHNFDMEFKDITGLETLLQCGGPRSLETLEKTFEQDLHDLKFNRLKTITYKGVELRVYRMGMAGALAYEIHGPIDFSHELYDDIYQAGKEFGIRRLGFHTYLMQHGMNGFTQFGQHYAVPACGEKRGSMKDQPDEAYRHNPYDTAQGFVVKYDHDFVGREALEKIRDNQTVKMVSLEWNVEDILDVYRSQYTDDPYLAMDEPSHFNNMGIQTWHDMVMVDGKQVGASTGRTFSQYYHKMISICYLDKEYANEGQEVVVIWGEPGEKQKEIRATVARFPYFNENRNEKFDVNTIPKKY